MRSVLSKSTTLVATLACLACGDIKAHGLTPELQAAMTIVVVQKCKDDQPQTVKELDVAFAAWEHRNHQYVVALHRDGEDAYREGLRVGREAYDTNGPFPIEYCKKLALALTGTEMDVSR